MKIISWFKSFFLKRKLKRQLSAFQKYLDNLEQSFLVFKLINEPNKKIIEFYEKSKLAGEYTALINQYDEQQIKRKNHNQRIEEIDLVVNTFSFSEIINDFDLRSRDLDQLKNIITEISNHDYNHKKYNKFILAVSELNDSRDIIDEQFKIIKETSKIYQNGLETNIYLDGKKELIIENFLNERKVKLESYEKTYYQIGELATYKEDVVGHNKSYVLRNMNNPLFDDINGKSLGNDQRKAILTDSVSNLVIAGAGSGKTLTICGKAKWLLEERKIPKDDILFLSFSKASADDLSAKLAGISDNLNVSTFHSLGLKIIESKTNKKQNIEENYDAIIERYFSEEMLKSQNIGPLRKMLEFYGQYGQSLVEERFATKGERFEKLKERDFQPLKEILLSFSNNPQEKETILKERVKSFEEMAIANFYFLNSVKYRYEKPYPIDTSTPDYRQYNPDFTLPDYDIYHEHYGIDRNGRATQYSAEEEAKYLETMEWKDQFHVEQKTKYIKTYSYQFAEETLFEQLEKQLIKFGVTLKPISDDEVRNALNSIYKSRNFKSIIRLVKTFISLYKSRYHDNTHFDIFKNERFNNYYEKARAALFLDICKDVYDYYKQELGTKIDFDDMILQAIKIIPNSDQFKYTHIVIDEFQDISYSRVQLIRTLIKHGDAKLFAVGDDWQSIYRFAGSDLGIFVNFEKYFAFTTECQLENNFRNSEELHEIIEPFITSNPRQKKKQIIAHKQLSNPVKIIYYKKSKISALNAALAAINKINPAADVLLLGRNNFDIEDYLSPAIQINPLGNIKHERYLGMDISFKTVHRSKGLEADFVIIINNDDARTGFPNKIEDDPLLSLVLSDKSNFEYAEERRLFYVALTRTKSYCYLLVNTRKPSRFVEEIKDKCEILNPGLSEVEKQISCPECKRGHLKLKGEWGEQFYGCSNYPYCKYSINKSVVENSKRCPRCNHFIVWRKGRYGYFLGCSDYPRCQISINPRSLYFDALKPESKNKNINN